MCFFIYIVIQLDSMVSDAQHLVMALIDAYIPSVHTCCLTRKKIRRTLSGNQKQMLSVAVVAIVL